MRLGWTHTNWSDPELWGKCGESLNLVVNVLRMFCTLSISKHTESGAATSMEMVRLQRRTVIVLNVTVGGERSGAADVNRNGAVTSVDAAENHADIGRKHRDRLVLSIMVMLTIHAMRRYDPRGRLTISLLTHHSELAEA